MATITAAAGGGAWNTGGSWVGGIAPGASDDVLLTVTSGNITISGTCACRSLDCTGYTGTLTQTSSDTLNVGDGTTGAFKLVAGMTYTTASGANVNFISTASGNNITTAGKSIGQVTFNGTGAWQLQDAMTSLNKITLTKGSLDTNGQTTTSLDFVSTGVFTRALTLGASTINVTGSGGSRWDFTATGMTFTCGTSILVFSGGSTTYNLAGLTYNTVQITGSGPALLTGANTFANFTRTGTAVKTDGLLLSANQTVNTALTLTGNSSVNRMFIKSDVRGTQRTITLGGSATFKTNSSNIDMQDMVMSGGAGGELNLSAISGLSGDCGNNSGITFTTGQTNFWFKDTGNFSNSALWFLATNGGGGAGRVPLPQDVARFDANSFSAGSKTVTQDMAQGPTINFTGSTNSPSIAFGTNTIYGSLTYISAMSSSGTPKMAYGGASTLTNNSFSGNGMTFDAGAGTITLADAYSATSSTTLLSGTLDANNQNMTMTNFTGSGTLTRALLMGSGTFNVTGTSNVWNMGTTTGLTFNAGTSTIIINNVTATGKTFAGGGLTYNNVNFSGDNITLSGSNTFTGTFAVNTAGLANGLLITSNTTQTLTAAANCFTTNGSAGNLARLTATTVTRATLTAPNQAQISVDYMWIFRSTVTQLNTWYAGANSTDGGTNTNWNFNVPPAFIARQGLNINQAVNRAGTY